MFRTAARLSPHTPTIAVQICFTVGGVEVGTRYRLVLPSGTQYGPGSTLSEDLALPFTATLPFTIPFPREPANHRATRLVDADFLGVDSTRIELYLPHGIADDASPVDLAARLKLEEVAAPWGGPAAPQAVDFTVNITDECAPRRRVSQFISPSCAARTVRS